MADIDQARDTATVVVEHADRINSAFQLPAAAVAQATSLVYLADVLREAFVK